MQPAGDSAAPASDIWTQQDIRTQEMIRAYMAQNVGVARPRTLTMTIPIAGISPPAAGWLTSVFITSLRVRFMAWMIHALVPGAISLDLQVSRIQSDPAVAPVLASLLTDPNADYTVDPAPYLLLNGYTVASFDTRGWFTRDLTGPFVLHVIVNSVTGVSQAVLGLHMVDLQGKTMQI